VISVARAAVPERGRTTPAVSAVTSGGPPGLGCPVGLPGLLRRSRRRATTSHPPRVRRVLPARGGPL